MSPQKHTDRIGGPGASHENRRQPEKSKVHGEREEHIQSEGRERMGASQAYRCAVRYASRVRPETVRLDATLKEWAFRRSPRWSRLRRSSKADPPA
jgi:hypothetical protein